MRATGTLVAWGLNSSGQLGDGSKTNRSLPVPVPGLTDVVKIACGADHSVALCGGDGTVWAWGEASRGQLGLGSTLDRVSPTRVTTMPSAVALGCGRDHTVAAAADGSTYAWGQNDYGQLGDGTPSGARHRSSYRV